MTSHPRLSRSKSVKRIWKTDAETIAVGIDPSDSAAVILRRVQLPMFRMSPRHVAAELKRRGGREFPGILTTSDVSLSSNHVTITLRGSNGTTFANLLADSDIDSSACLVLLHTFAEKLDSLHANGVVHGDIRPESLFVDTSGELKAIDFATQHLIFGWDQGQFQTDVDLLSKMLPQAYMAPECLQGVTASPASDQYALATVCLETLAGLRITTERPREVLLRKLPSSIRPLFTRAFSEIPAERFATCAELITMVRQTHEKQSGDRRFWCRTAVAIIAPFLFVPAIWMYSSSVQSGIIQAATDAKDARIKQAVEHYSVPPTMPRLTMRSDLSRDRDSHSQYQEWVAAGEARRTTRTASEFEALLDNLTALQWTASLREANPGDAEVILFTDSGKPLARGRTDSPLTITSLPLPKELLPDANASPLSQRLVAFFSVGADAVEQPFRLKAIGDSLHVLEVSIDPPRGGWSPAISITAELHAADPLTSETHKLHLLREREIHVGVLSWSAPSKIAATPREVVNRRNSVPTGVKVTEGQRFSVDVSGTVQIWDAKVHLLLQSQGVKQDVSGYPHIGPDGVVCVRRVIGTFRYRPEYQPRDSSLHWGALIMKIGPSGPWFVPTAVDQPIIATRSGELHLGINSIVAKSTPSSTIPLWDDPSIWADKGQFDLTITTLHADFPAGAPLTIRRSVLDRVQPTFEGN